MRAVIQELSSNLQQTALSEERAVWAADPPPGSCAVLLELQNYVGFGVQLEECRNGRPPVLKNSLLFYSVQVMGDKDLVYL